MVMPGRVSVRAPNSTRPASRRRTRSASRPVSSLRRSEERRVGKECQTTCRLVTGVQTCALPIYGDARAREREGAELDAPREQRPHAERESARVELEERRGPELPVLADLERVQLDGRPRED